MRKTVKPKTFFAIIPFSLCASCGSFGNLEPAEGASLPVQAYAQKDEQSAGRLLQATPQARPNREAEILSKSTVRSEDPFDLPPEPFLQRVAVDDISADSIDKQDTVENDDAPSGN